MWCSAESDEPWSYAPCVFQTAGGAIFLPLTLWVVTMQLRRTSRIMKLPNRVPVKAAGRRCLAAGLVVLSILLHMAYIILLSKSQTLWNPPYEWFFNVGMAVSWLLVLGLLCRCFAVWTPVRVKAAGIVGFVVYMAWFVGFFSSNWKTMSEVGTTGWIGLGMMLAAMLCSIGIIFVEQIRPTSEEEEPLLDEASKDVENGDKPQRNWLQLFGRALLYVWPKDWYLQFKIFLCILCLAALRALNLLVPIFHGKVIDTLAEVSTAPDPSSSLRKLMQEKFTFGNVFYPWVLLYVISVAIAGHGSGTGSVITTLRQYLFFPITQHAHRRICIDVFSHILNLNLNFHLERKTGEVIRVMDRGTGAIQSVLTSVIFNIGPKLVDMMIAIVYISGFVEGWIGLVIIGTLVLYVPVTFFLTEKRTRLKKELNKKDNKMGFKATDAFLNYETVKYFNNEEFETKEFDDVVVDYQKTELYWTYSLYIMNGSQTLIMTGGVVASVLLCVRGVVNKEMTVGKFTLVLSLLYQLYAPLNYLGSYYRMVQNYATDMENMYALIDTAPTLKDDPNAQPLQLKTGAVEFENVSFSYKPGRSVLNNVSFSIHGGGTLGIVGSTGSGKSSLLRLLFRLYDTTEGCVKIDGQRIDKVTMESLQKAIAYVPQDTVLFNDTILYNIRYGDINATDEEVFNVADMVSLHENIMTNFPAGYETTVGERGLRLSGGEKQRVAFARAILKSAPILVLDEATSSLDSITEKKVQETLMKSREKQTTIIVAHRLGTIMDADMIVVMKDGEVAEMGSHSELIAQNGIYTEMWEKQESGMDLGSPLASDKGLRTFT